MTNLTSNLGVGGYTMPEVIGPPLMYVVTPPVAANSPGIKNQFSYDASFFYICVATDTWLRTDILTW